MANYTKANRNVKHREDHVPAPHTKQFQEHTSLKKKCIVLLTFMCNHSGNTQLSAGGNFLCVGLE